ncbi:hypothetical protein Aau02nite_25330 [Amorphoplanes auranticolor]|uniref:DUF4020 domain-containing protein n=2 Tax=Actinoplanes auranticolor TaxID=47988 RepID=A0A919SAR0_9ACTN|nr:hypothetical protein Aau02nite_25330 [Actinoplanes auranticolor]
MGQVDIPAELLEAHAAGRLLLFVGAGASVDPPSGLPLFDKLAETIAEEAHQAPVAGDRPDRLLGRIDDHKVDVHLRVQQIVGGVDSRPNRLHRAIVALAMAQSPLRIVTTNYDKHLSTVLTAQGATFEEYAGPAVPPGDDIEGVVHLHGRLGQSPKYLIATDRDFGQAYLRSAWAARFLEQMFAEYTVLFIGYSHTDVVMTFFARALTANRRRYVLTDKPDDPDWEGYGVTPIPYVSVGIDHSALSEAIEKWAAQAAMGLLDHRQRIKDLVTGAPSLEPEDMSYLESVLADPLRVELFTELADGTEWLRWATNRPEFQQTLAPQPASSPSTEPLARWFVRNFVLTEQHNDEALRVVQQAGGRLSPAVAAALVNRLYGLPTPLPPWLALWVILLMDTPTAAAHRPLGHLLNKCTWPRDRDLALLLFDHLAEPVPVLRGGFGAYLDPEPRGDRWSLAEAWKRVFRPHLSEAAEPVLAVVERQLHRAFVLLRADGSAGERGDPVSSRRAAIPAHAQDTMPKAMDTLIDAARDCLEALLATPGPADRARLDRWAAAETTLLRRLAVHGWTVRTDVDATAKIRWLRERQWLYAHELRFEVFALIEAALADAEPAVADALVAEAAAGPGRTDRESLAGYVTFNALAWITRCAPALVSAAEAFAAVRATHPTFVVREHPELLRTWSFSAAGTPPALSAAELHEDISADATAALGRLRAAAAEEDEFSAGVHDVLTEAVRERPEDGFAILDAHAAPDQWIIDAVVAGWSGATIPESGMDTVLDRLASLDVPATVDAISRLLADGGQSDQHPTHWYRRPAARRLATDAWNAAHATPGHDFDDWLTRALNQNAGRIALFWVHAVADDWRRAGDSWTGLDPAVRTTLEELLSAGDSRSAPAETILASQARFFFGADRTWSEEHILPLLDWRDPVRARHAWDGHLVWGRFDDQMLETGLADDYVGAARHIGAFPEDMRRQLHQHLAAVAVGSDLPTIHDWVHTLTAELSVADRVEWLQAIAHVLAGLPGEAVEHQWSRWMSRYWQDRLESNPRLLEIEEASAMAGWTAYLTDSAADGVALATRHPARLPVDSGVLLDLADENRLRRAPAAYGRLIGHLLSHTEPPFRDGYLVPDIVERLKANGAVEDLPVIVTAAIRLGVPGAAEWI